MRRAHLRLTATVAALLVALGGCGGSSTEIGELPADAVFLTAVDRSTDVSTVRVQYESTTRRDGEVMHAGTGEAVFAPGAVSLTFDMGGLGYEGETPEELSYELRFVDGTMYLRVPELLLGMDEEDLPDAEWVVYDDADTGEMAAQLEQLDFGATLQALRDTADVTEDGRETIADVQTTRYVGTTTLRSLLLAQGMTEEQLEEEQRQLEPDGGPDLDDPMPLTVWIGDDGLVRRYDYTMVDGELETTQSMTVLEYGLEVEIVAPPAEATMRAEEFESHQSSSRSFGSDLDVEYAEDSEGSEGSGGSMGSGGSIIIESEGSATAERSATGESVPAPQSTGDGDG